MTTKRPLQLPTTEGPSRPNTAYSGVRQQTTPSALVADINSDIVDLRVLTKTVRWLGDSKRRIREFPHEARQRTGYDLWEVQQGNEPSDWKPMPSVGRGVNEIRVHARGEHRVVYVAKFEEAVYVLHVFEKKTQRTPKQDLRVAADRYRALVRERVRKR